MAEYYDQIGLEDDLIPKWFVDIGRFIDLLSVIVGALTVRNYIDKGSRIFEANFPEYESVHKRIIVGVCLELYYAALMMAGKHVQQGTDMGSGVLFSLSVVTMSTVGAAMFVPDTCE